MQKEKHWDWHVEIGSEHVDSETDYGWRYANELEVDKGK